MSRLSCIAHCYYLLYIVNRHLVQNNHAPLTADAQGSGTGLGSQVRHTSISAFGRVRR